MTYSDEDRYEDTRIDAMEDARRDAMADAYTDMLREAGPCEGTGYIVIPCSGRHAYNCGGPDCEGDNEIECPGCEDCENDDEWRIYHARGVMPTRTTPDTLTTMVGR